MRSSTSALDPELVWEASQVMSYLAKIGMTMVVVKHEVWFAREVGDQLAFVDDGLVVERVNPREMIAAPKKSANQGVSLTRPVRAGVCPFHDAERQPIRDYTTCPITLRSAINAIGTIRI